jgi:hypothetical protein
MKLNKGDIRQLYGEQLFFIPAQQEQEELDQKGIMAEANDRAQIEENIPAEQPAQEVASIAIPEPAAIESLNEGEPVQWKMRSTATIALVLKQNEFRNKLITNGLKQIVLDAGISPQAIGFGVLEGEASQWNFSEMPVPVAVVFHPIKVRSNPVKLPAGTVHISYPVAEIVMDTNKQKALLKLFSSIL